MGTPLIAGRDFTPADTVDSRRVAIVNESFARTLVGARNPIGSTFQMSAAPGATPPTYEVVGLVRDTKYTGLREPFEPIAFLPTTQERRPLEYVNITVRASGVVTTRTLADAVSRVEPRAVVLVQSFRAQVADSLVRERLVAMLSGFFGAVAALLAMLGLYGVVSYGVTQRTREIGIRTALGAAPSAVLALVLRQSLLLTAIGVASGLGAAALGTRYFESNAVRPQTARSRNVHCCAVWIRPAVGVGGLRACSTGNEGGPAHRAAAGVTSGECRSTRQSLARPQAGFTVVSRGTHPAGDSGRACDN